MVVPNCLGADWLFGMSLLKWVATVEVPPVPYSAPLEPEVSLVLLLAPLDLADSVMTVFYTVGQ